MHADIYDRSDAAVNELLAIGTMTRAAIETVARTHEVCPFELSLDAAVWADVVICDYNYVFDPVVRLKRLAGDHRRSNCAADRRSPSARRPRPRRAVDGILAQLSCGAPEAALSAGLSARRAAALDRRLTDAAARRGARSAVSIVMRSNAASNVRTRCCARPTHCSKHWPNARARSQGEPDVTELTFALLRLAAGRRLVRRRTLCHFSARTGAATSSSICVVSTQAPRSPIR